MSLNFCLDERACSEDNGYTNMTDLGVYIWTNKGATYPHMCIGRYFVLEGGIWNLCILFKY